MPILSQWIYAITSFLNFCLRPEHIDIMLFFLIFMLLVNYLQDVITINNRMLYTFHSLGNICHMLLKAAIPISILVVLYVLRETSNSRDSAEELSFVTIYLKIYYESSRFPSKNMKRTHE